MPHPTANPDEGSLELTEDLVRARACRFYEDRGCEDGHDLEDWLRAKAEVFGKKPSVAPKQRIRWAGSGRMWRKESDPARARAESMEAHVMRNSMDAECLTGLG